MATGFSVFVNIGGKVNPSLAGAISAAKSQVNGLTASLARMAAQVNAPFNAVNRHIAETSKRMAVMQRHGRNATLGVTTPAAWFGVNMIKDASDFAKAGNMVEALGEATTEQRNQLSALSQDLAKRYDAGGATGIMKTATELLKAGFTYEQARGALEQVLAASALAGDMLPSDVGASLSKTITQFAMPMKTYEQSIKSATTVTDRMVYAAVSTVASMKDIAESLKYAGSIAATTGNSFDSVTATIMGFAKAGTLGSEAGVAYRSGLVRMVNMPKKGMERLNRMGLRLSDYVKAEPVTAEGIISTLKSSGIDASGSAAKIGSLIKGLGDRNPEDVIADITKAVQESMGSDSAVDADMISSAVSDAMIRGSKADFVGFIEALKKKIESGKATTTDIARVLEGRHISRYLGLMRSDLPSLIQEVIDKSDGYSQKQYKIANKGLPAVLLKLDAAYRKVRNTVVESVGDKIADTFERIASSMDAISQSNPALIRMGVGFAVAAAAAGPLLFAFGALARIGLFGLRALSFAVWALVAPISLLVGLIGTGLAAALLRLRTAMFGLAMLGSVGGSGAVLAALGGGLLSLGRSILMFPVTALRAIGVAMWGLVANPVGIAITAVVAALAALGVWVYNNWEGIKSFFAGFGSGFMEGLGPAAEVIGKVTSGLGAAFDWLGKLLGPISATNEQWRGWGATLGGVVASGVSAVINGISRLIGFFDTVIGKAMQFGGALRSLWPFGGAAAPGAAPAPPIAGARAFGGPVSFGKPYLVGERGPELFVPGASGRIESNNRLRRLTADGTAAVAGSSSSYSAASSNSATISIQVSGNADPHDIAREAEAAVYRAFARLESEQRGLLSD